ncbi:chitobiase/beta-hexosaminidase C-terminal domain-containing protein [Paenibacillus sp.]|uniref:chitobiase/beta-hexosaminidase C-terminal domain-containing protein n=1 Tax=Paenibacillus sp. TaxID=58172 RepID=UPI002D51A7D0|nr:chitobiase/beta-hexosaminidase C-terminal domain-containing protein [Paenibacillus sp.]HZG88085.1 chitobiase/beta-hexosaminidase C-terminal domain-containing protein [Paenibacillus sp.]
MIRKHRRVGFALSIVALLAAMWTCVQWATAGAHHWTDHADSGWYDPIYPSYTIDTPAKLAGAAKLVNDGVVDGFAGKVLEIDRNLDLSAYEWVPIGTAANPFKGTLIAKGGATVTIDGMKITGDVPYAGLIGVMQGGTVGGFTFAGTGFIDVQSVSEDVYAGSAVGWMSGVSTVYDISNYMTVEADAPAGISAAGGIAGSAGGVIANSNNYAAVTTTGSVAYAGGVAGQTSAQGLVMKKVGNAGAIRSGSASGTIVYAGGIAGATEGALTMNEDDTPIGNTGSVSGFGGTTVYAGGILGSVGGPVAFSSNTSNSGAVLIDAAAAQSTHAGTLAGSVRADLGPLSFTFTNTGTVENRGGTRAMTGGLVGSTAAPFEWASVYTNAASVTASGVSEVYTGGLVGYAERQLRFASGAHNAGAVTVTGAPAEAYTGGLVGRASERLLLDSDAPSAYTNSGAISVNGGTGVYTGGIVSNRAYARTSALPSDNVVSSGDITVNAVSAAYTGGYIGALTDGVDRTVTGASFAGRITVAATGADADRPVRTGGVVGYIADGTVANGTFRGSIAATGGSHVLTGGIAGATQNATLSGSRSGNASDAFATIASDGVAGGVVGQSNGTVSQSAVGYLALTATTDGGTAGGIAGRAVGVIDNAVSGVENSDAFASVTLRGAGIDQLTAGGIVGTNDGALRLTGIRSIKVQLLADTGTTGHRLGGVAGLLTAESIVGAADALAKAEALNFDVPAGGTDVGGIVGVNRTSHLYAESDGITLRIQGAAVQAGGIAGANEAELADGASRLIAKNGSYLSTGNTVRMGGVFGENRSRAANAAAEHIDITAEGSANDLGGIAGRNVGLLADASALNVTLQPKGEFGAAGGIVGRSERSGGEAPSIVDPIVEAQDAPLATVTGANVFVGGIAGIAKETAIDYPTVKAETPNVVMLTIRGNGAQAGGIAGRLEQSTARGDTFRANAENVLISVAAEAANVYAGGLVGYSDVSGLDSLVGQRMNVIVSGPNAVAGGMAGYHRGTNAALIHHVYLTEFNLRTNESASGATIGGFVGLNDARAGDPTTTPATTASSIQKSRIVGAVQSQSPSSKIGGMAGENRTLIANNSISDKIPVTSKGNGSVVGGLAGVNAATGTLYYTYANSTLTVEGESATAGGLVGANDGRIVASYVDIDVAGKSNGTASAWAALGGLVGRTSGAIEASYANAKVAAAGAYTLAGGFAGELTGGSIANAYAAKSVDASGANSYAGGFLGRITGGQVNTAYAAGRVTASNGALAGGFAGRYDTANKELLFRTYYMKDEAQGINADLPDFAEGNYRWLNNRPRISTILGDTLKDRAAFPALSGWDFAAVWKYGSLNAEYQYPELIRSANTGGGDGSQVNANINWYTRDKDAVEFELRTEAELAGLAAVVNGTVPGLAAFDFAGRTIRIVQPIHIQSSQWVPIGIDDAHAFQGALDGGGHLIDGFTVKPGYDYAGLFGILGVSSSVERLSLEPLAVEGVRLTGALAGLGRGSVSDVDVQLVREARVSGNVVGGILGKNEGTIDGLSVALGEQAVIEGVSDRAVVGGAIGDNAAAVPAGALRASSLLGTIRSAGAETIAGGLIGRQAGNVAGLTVEAGYALQTTGADAMVGGLVGHFVSGRADTVKLVLNGGDVQALGANSTVGGIAGRSEAANPMSGVSVEGVQAGGSIKGTAVVGGIAGAKLGSGTNAFDMQSAHASGVAIASADNAAQPAVGGIVGVLTDAAVSDAVSNAAIRASGNRAAAGGIAGTAENSIVYRAAATPNIALSAAATEGAAGGIVGTLSSGDPNRAYDFGLMIPLYHGVYDAKTLAGSIKADSANQAAVLYAGGIAGKLSGASIYQSKSSASIEAHGADQAYVGGIAGHSDGIVVGAVSESGVSADTSRVYRVGGAFGAVAGGEIHYSRTLASGSVNVGSAVGRPLFLPATRAGGFAGTVVNAVIERSYAEAAVSVQDTNPDNTLYAGGFAGTVGEDDPRPGRIREAYASGAVALAAQGGSHVGGFAGSVDHYEIDFARASGSLQHTGFDPRTGGFAAAVERNGRISNAYALSPRMEASGTEQSTRLYIGGFAAYNDGDLDSVYSGGGEAVIRANGNLVYRGALLGYQYKDGSIVSSAHAAPGSPIGYQLGTAAGIAAEDRGAAISALYWNFDIDTAFLSESALDTVSISTVPQLLGAILLYNEDSGLAYYRLYHRTAAAAPELERFSLAADLDGSNVQWLSFAAFRGTFEGNGHVIHGFRAAGSGDVPAGFARENFGTISNLTFRGADVAGAADTGVVAGVNRAGGAIRSVEVSGTVRGGARVGAIAGTNEGTVSEAKTDAAVVARAAASPLAAGGIAGRNAAPGVIRDSAFAGGVEAEGADLVQVGGIAGVNEGRIESADIRGSLNGKAAGRLLVGGAAGGNAASGTIAEAASSVAVEAAAGALAVGGIAGDNAGAIENGSYDGALNAAGAPEAKIGGIAGSNQGRIAGANAKGTIAGAEVSRLTAGGIVGENLASGVVESAKSSVGFQTKGDELAVGGVVGTNFGEIGNSSYTGRLQAEGAASLQAGGIAGTNRGRIAVSFASGAVTAAGPALQAGGIAGGNLASGIIAESFAYSAVRASGASPAAGGIAGRNEGGIEHVSFAGEVRAEGTNRAYAGGIAGVAASGAISRSINVGEAEASVAGAIVPGTTFFGGVAGQKLAAATISNSVFNKQMLKTNTAYYDEAAKRVSGDIAGARGLPASALASGSVPNGLQADRWIAAAGSYPRLAAFGASPDAALASVAVVFAERDGLYGVSTDFEVTGDAGIAWTANPNEIVFLRDAGKLKARLRTAGAVTLTAKAQGLSRDIVVNEPPLRFAEQAKAPYAGPGERSFASTAQVVLITDEPGGVIYYTLDGSAPTVYSMLYTGPIALNDTATIKAIAVAEDKESSAVFTGVWQKLNPGFGGFVFVPIVEPKPEVVARIGGVEAGAGDQPVKVAKNSKVTLTAPEGRKLYYTTDGSKPTKSSAVYDGAIVVTRSTTIRVLVEGSDVVESFRVQVGNAAYSVKPEAAEIRYMTGYADGTFKPDAALSRGELVRAIAPLIDMEEVDVANVFSDVAGESETLVAFFASAGLIQGYPDGTFGTDRGLTRAEFVVIMARLLQLEQQRGTAPLADVRGHWSEGYVNAFTAAGYIQGFPDGTFRPDEELTRAQAVVLINRMLGAKAKADARAFADVDASHWAYEQIMAAAQ